MKNSENRREGGEEGDKGRGKGGMVRGGERGRKRGSQKRRGFRATNFYLREGGESRTAEN